MQLKNTPLPGILSDVVKDTIYDVIPPVFPAYLSGIFLLSAEVVYNGHFYRRSVVWYLVNKFSNTLILSSIHLLTCFIQIHYHLNCFHYALLSSQVDTQIHSI